MRVRTCVPLAPCAGSSGSIRIPRSPRARQRFIAREASTNCPASRAQNARIDDRRCGFRRLMGAGFVRARTAQPRSRRSRRASGRGAIARRSSDGHRRSRQKLFRAARPAGAARCRDPQCREPAADARAHAGASGRWPRHGARQVAGRSTAQDDAGEHSTAAGFDCHDDLSAVGADGPSSGRAVGDIDAAAAAARVSATQRHRQPGRPAAPSPGHSQRGAKSRCGHCPHRHCRRRSVSASHVLRLGRLQRDPTSAIWAMPQTDTYSYGPSISWAAFDLGRVRARIDVAEGAERRRHWPLTNLPC